MQSTIATLQTTCDPGLLQDPRQEATNVPRILLILAKVLANHGEAYPKDDEEEEAEDDPKISSFSSFASSVLACWSPSGQQSRHHLS